MTTAPADDAGAAPATRIGVARGNLYLTHETCETFLAGAHAIALLVRDGRVLLVPLMPGSAGGLLLKVRNARGDRVVHAQEFFREKGYLEAFEEIVIVARWSTEDAALEVLDLPKARS